VNLQDQSTALQSIRRRRIQPKVEPKKGYPAQCLGCGSGDVDDGYCYSCGRGIKPKNPKARKPKAKKPIEKPKSLDELEKLLEGPPIKASVDYELSNFLDCCLGLLILLCIGGEVTQSGIIGDLKKWYLISRVKKERFVERTEYVAPSAAIIPMGGSTLHMGEPTIRVYSTTGYYYE